MLRYFVLFLIMTTINVIWAGFAAVFQPEWLEIVWHNVPLAITLELVGVSCTGFGLMFLFKAEK